MLLLSLCLLEVGHDDDDDDDDVGDDDDDDDDDGGCFGVGVCKCECCM